MKGEDKEREGRMAAQLGTMEAGTLYDTPFGRIAAIKCWPSKITCVCRGCVFDGWQVRSEGQCPMRWGCMSRYRADRMSVRFVRPEDLPKRISEKEREQE